MKDVNGKIIPEADHRIKYEERREVLYESYLEHLPLYKKYYEAKQYSRAKIVASLLGQPLYDATKTSQHYSGYYTTGAVENELKPGKASVEHPYGRTDAAVEIYNESLRKNRRLHYEEFCNMIDRLCFTVHATREENRNLSILSREDREESWIDVYIRAKVDLYEVPVEKIGRRKVYHFDQAKKIGWLVIEDELAH
jgi:hypothetical protein